MPAKDKRPEVHIQNKDENTMNRLATGCSLLLLIAFAVAARAQENFDRPRISVTGEAVVNVVPDKVLLTFGVETWDKDIEQAKRMNTDIQKRARAAFGKIGIREKDIQTDQLTIEPRWDDNPRREFIGYFVRTTLEVTAATPPQAEELIPAALDAGVNYVHGMEFQNTEFKKHRERARELALKAAREKAEKMASALGASIGEPLLINEGGSPWGYSSGWGYGRRGGGMTQNVVQDMGGSAYSSGGDSIALGKIGIRATVSVTFELRTR